jgi:hypothetical protein
MSSHVLFRRAAVLVCLAAVLTGCRNGPTDPHGPRQASLTVTCIPAGPRVSCSATYLPAEGFSRDVTSLATFRASDPSLGSFRDGLFTPVRRGEVEINARYNGLVDPAQTARRLYFLSGIVRDDSNNQALVGATVEVLDGYSKGAQSVTNGAGAYQFNDILTGETFSVRASKPGYTSSTLTYRVDSPIGPSGNPPFLDFRLRRIG